MLDELSQTRGNNINILRSINGLFSVLGQVEMEEDLAFDQNSLWTIGDKYLLLVGSDKKKISCAKLTLEGGASSLYNASASAHLPPSAQSTSVGYVGQYDKKKLEKREDATASIDLPKSTISDSTSTITLTVPESTTTTDTSTNTYTTSYTTKTTTTTTTTTSIQIPTSTLTTTEADTSTQSGTLTRFEFLFVITLKVQVY